MSADKQDGQSEPTMEEILSSIRRIISDEDQEEAPPPPKPAPAPVAAVAPEPEPDPFEEEDFAPVTPAPEAQADVLELTKVVNDDGSVTDIEESPLDIDVIFEEKEEAAAPPPPLEPSLPPMEPAAPIMGEAAANAAAAALNQLVVEMPKYIGVGQGLTLEEITKELLRPMLKQWLDAHLPATVERLVQEEIARVSRLHR